MNYTPLIEKIGYQFKDLHLLDLAFTHRSKSSDINYERLEFFGDRILGFCLSKKLYEEFKGDDEGMLARRFASLAKQDTLATIARNLELSQFLKLSYGEIKAGGTERDSVLADTVESLLAAICIDGGIEEAEKFVSKFWRPFFYEPDLGRKDARSHLQEIAQKMGKPLPIYDVIEVSGTEHQPQYLMEVTVEGYDPVRASGNSKRTASHKAAEELLNIILRKI